MRLRNIPGADDVIQNHPVAIKNEIEQKGKWHTVFGNENPIHIEIGMGKGQFLLNLAKQNPQINYIGIERYSSVLLRALEKYDTEEFCDMKNIRFICMDAFTLPDVFGKGEVAKIYLNFSDPWPKARHAGRRLTSTRFLDSMTRCWHKTVLWNLRQITASCLSSLWNRWRKQDGNCWHIHMTCITMKR